MIDPGFVRDKPDAVREGLAKRGADYSRELEELAVRLAEVTGQPRSRVEDDLSAGRVLSAAEAQEYGLVDEIVGKA